MAGKEVTVTTGQQRIYFWAPNSQRSIAADVVAARIDTIAAQRGVCHPQDLVDDARPPASPIHTLFEWDDEVAAELYRRDQARSVIRIIRPRFSAEEERAAPFPAYVHVRVNGQDGYMRTDQARASDEVWAEVLDDALKQLEGLQKRYAHLSELTQVWQAIAEVKKSRKPGRRVKQGAK